MMPIKFEIVVRSPRGIEFLMETFKRMLIEGDIVKLEISGVKEGDKHGD